MEKTSHFGVDNSRTKMPTTTNFFQHFFFFINKYKTI